MKKITVFLIFWAIMGSNYLFSNGYEWKKLIQANNKESYFKSWKVELNQIDCYDGLNCLLLVSGGTYDWTYPYGGQLLLTSDGGKSWKVVLDGKPDFYDEDYNFNLDIDEQINRPRFTHISYPGPGLIVMTDDSARLHRSTDLGETWIITEHPVEEKENPYDVKPVIQMYDENHGFMYLWWGYLYYTNDGCQTWKRYDFPSTLWQHPDYEISFFQILDFVMPSQDITYFSIYSSRRKTSGERTRQWLLLAIDFKSDTVYQREFQDTLGFIDFVSRDIGFGASIEKVEGTGDYLIKKKKLYKTTNGGVSWELLSEHLSKPRGISDWQQTLNFFDEQYGVFTGVLASYQYTTDGGYTWHDVDIVGESIPERVQKRQFVENFQSSYPARDTVYILAYSLFDYYLIKGEPKSTSISKKKLADALSLYPNPTRDILHIRTDELIARAELCDLLGNVVISDLTPTLTKGDGVSINVESLPAGMYFLKLYTMSGEVLVEKVVVGF